MRAKVALEKTIESEEDKNDEEINQDFLDLCERVDKVRKWKQTLKNIKLLKNIFSQVIPRLESFAPWHYFLKATFIWSVAIALEAHMHWNKSYPWYETAILGFFFALMGLNIAHDGNHGALSRKSWVNRFWGM